MSDKIDFAAKSKTLAGSPLADLLFDAQFAPLAKAGNPSKDAKVEALQKALRQLGYDIGKSGADGMFGRDTETAVKKFQSDVVAKMDPGPLGVATPPSDGRVDWMTLLALDAACVFVESQPASSQPASSKPAQPQSEPPSDFVLGVDYFEPDLSGHKPDWTKATAKPSGKDAPLSYVFIQALEGRIGKQWTTFKRDWQAAGDAGLVRGTYFFLSFPHSRIKGTPPSPADQAKNFADIVGDLQKTGANADFPPGFDVEFPGAKLLGPDGKYVLGKDGKPQDDPHEGWTFTGMTQAKLFEGIVSAWKALKDAYGAAPIIYTSGRVWRDDLGNPAAPASAPGLVDSPLWLAKYYSATRDGDYFNGGKHEPLVPPPWGDQANWWLHQYHGDSSFPGFNQVSGMDRFHAMVKGAQGARVKWVQRRLGIDQTGTYDDAAVAEVKKVQSANGINPADGVIGPRTFAVLCWMNPPKS